MAGRSEKAVEKRDGATYRDLMIGAGVAVDKARLLAGEPTAVVEHRIPLIRQAYAEIIELIPADEARQLICEEFELGPDEWRQVEGGQKGEQALLPSAT